MINIIKQEIEIEETLKRRLEIICDFCNTTPKIINGSIRKVDKTNLSYIEPHRIIIKNITFLVFNYSNEIYTKESLRKLQDKMRILCIESFNKEYKLNHTLLTGSVIDMLLGIFLLIRSIKYKRFFKKYNKNN